MSYRVTHSYAHTYTHTNTDFFFLTEILILFFTARQFPLAPLDICNVVFHLALSILFLLFQGLPVNCVQRVTLVCFASFSVILEHFQLF